MFGHDSVQLFAHGGPTLVVIVACSVLALIIAAERVIATWSVVAKARQLADQVARHLLRGDVAQARAACERSRALGAEMFIAGFARHAQGATQTFDGAVERERVNLLLKLKSHLWGLGTIGTVSPFVGLFGTVVGIRNAFTAMAAAGTGGFAVVADGISEALITTAAGIFVAVEAVVLYNFFQARLGRASAELKLLADEFVELLREPPRTPAQQPPESGASGSETGAAAAAQG